MRQKRLFQSAYTTQINQEKIVHLTNSGLVQSTKVNGKEDSEMALVSRHGLMAPSILVNGVKTKLMVKGNSSMSMETYTMDFGRMTKLMVFP